LPEKKKKKRRRGEEPFKPSAKEKRGRVFLSPENRETDTPSVEGRKEGVDSGAVGKKKKKRKGKLHMPPPGD